MVLFSPKLIIFIKCCALANNYLAAKVEKIFVFLQSANYKCKYGSIKFKYFNLKRFMNGIFVDLNFAVKVIFSIFAVDLR